MHAFPQADGMPACVLLPDRFALFLSTPAAWLLPIPVSCFVSFAIIHAVVALPRSTRYTPSGVGGAAAATVLCHHVGCNMPASAPPRRCPSPKRRWLQRGRRAPIPCCCTLVLLQGIVGAPTIAGLRVTASEKWSGAQAVRWWAAVAGVGTRALSPKGSGKTYTPAVQRNVRYITDPVAHACFYWLPTRLLSSGVNGRGVRLGQSSQGCPLRCWMLALARTRHSCAARVRVL